MNHHLLPQRCLTALRTVSQLLQKVPGICPASPLGPHLSHSPVRQGAVRLSSLSTFLHAPPSAWNFSPTSQLVLPLVPQDLGLLLLPRVLYLGPHVCVGNLF